jgi:hypothetical protein
MNSEDVLLKVMDKDTFVDDCIGEVSIPARLLCKNYGGE